KEIHSLVSGRGVSYPVAMHPFASWIRAARITLAGVVMCLGVPATVFGQGALAGVVTDPTGAVLPYVTVQAQSSELMERVRTTTTDAAGQYRIENLRPGRYSLTFLLDGWSPFVRTDVEVIGSSSTTADAQLRIGPLTDTV